MLLLLPLVDGQAGVRGGACGVNRELFPLAALAGFDSLVDAILVALAAT